MSGRRKAPVKRVATPATPTPCCPQWQAFPAGSKNWGWTVLHRLGHSRMAFTEAKVTTLAGVDTERELIADATNFGWIAPTPIGDRPHYVGRLASWPRGDS
jgi:hypothetical protein